MEEEKKKKRSNREEEEEENMATHTMVTGKKRSRTVLNNEVEEEKLRPWSDLPREVLELIKKRLFFAGQLTFHAVCKSWSSIDSFPPQNQIPWVIAFEENFKINKTWRCKLVDPTSSKTYSIDMKAIKEKKKIKDFNTMEVHESKYGWLLISSYNEQNISLFLFSPFHKEKKNLIELPDLHQDNMCYGTLATFTSNPLEEDCLFLIAVPLRKGTVIHTCRRGDKSWSCLDSYLPVSKFIIWTRWTYSEGIFYYIYNHYDNYKMGTFDFARKKWSVIPTPPPTSPPAKSVPPYSFDFYIVKTDGEEELFLVCAPDLKGYFIGYIYRLDLSSMIWERVNSLGDNVLFIGDGYSSVLKLSEMKMKGISPDMVYYCVGSNLGCLSAVDHIHMKDKSHQGVSFDYGSMATKSCCRKIFIDPPPHHHYHH